MLAISIDDRKLVRDIAIPLVRNIVRHSPCAFCTDFDGTLSPISPTAQSAEMLPEIRQLLPSVIACFDYAAIVSGRDVGSLWDKVRIPGIFYIGDHGNRMWQASDNDSLPPPTTVLDPAIAATIDTLFAQYPTMLTDVFVERKTVTTSLHFRTAPDQAGKRQQLLAALAPIISQTGIHIAEGKALIELTAATAQNKGDALLKLIQQLHLQSIIYMGDDLTDITGFRALRQIRATTECRTVCVGINHTEAPPALRNEVDILLGDIQLVPALLAAICESK